MPPKKKGTEGAVSTATLPAAKKSRKTAADENADASDQKRDADAALKYKALNQRNHLLQRPDMVLGSIARSEHKATRMYDPASNRMVFADATYSGAMMQVIQELLTNAGDREFKNDPVRLIEIEVPSVEESAEKPIVVRNDGDGIPILLKALDDDIGGGEKYIPEICFGVFNAGENFDDSQVRWAGGRNGIGAKASNVYSRRFTVRVKDPHRKKQFEQEFWDNMGQRSEPKIKAYANKSGMVEVSMLPDYVRFGYADGRMDETLRALIITRAYDLAACTGSHIRVKLNGVEIKVRGMQQYADLMFGDDRKAAPRFHICQEVPFEYAASTTEDGTVQEKVVKQVARLEMVVAHAEQESGAHVVGFVNALPCNAGKHVQYLMERIADDTIKHFKTKKASKFDKIDPSQAPDASSSSSALFAGEFCDYTKLKPAMIKNNVSIVIKVLIDNPEFTTQSKEELGTIVSKWGFRVALPDDLPQKVQKLGVLRSAMYEAAAAEQKALGRSMQTAAKTVDSSAGRLKRRLNLPKLDDAHNAGVKGEHNVLILIEGDSAKEMVLAGMSVVGKDNWGVFPLRGKMLNVAQASMADIAKNVEVQYLCQILGVKPGQPVESVSQLRYQQIFMLTDSDNDGAHIGGLIMSFVHTMWPRIAADPSFFVRFRTPVRVARLKSPAAAAASAASKKTGAAGKKKASSAASSAVTLDEMFFLTEHEYTTWLDSGVIPPCNIVNDNDEDDERVDPVLRDSFASAEERLQQYSIQFLKGLGTSTTKMAMRYFRYLKRFVLEIDCSAPADQKLLQMAFGDKSQHRKDFVDMHDNSHCLDYSLDRAPFADFMRSELCGFWYADCKRSLPHAVDGLKPGQRKVLYYMLTRSKNKEERVSTLASQIISRMAYHHGEASMVETVVLMAQNHFGTNNINLLVPSGQFGSLIFPRKTHSAARYLYSYREDIALSLFPKEDFAVLLPLSDDGVRVEPAFLAPILPLLLINGSSGIGSGYSANIPSFRPTDIIRLVNETLIDYVAFLDSAAQEAAIDMQNAPFTIGTRGWLSVQKRSEWLSSPSPSAVMQIDNPQDDLTPWFDLFNGSVLPIDGKPDSYAINGCFQRMADGVHVRITELPVGQWKDSWLASVVARNLYDPTGSASAKQAPKKRTKAIADGEEEEESNRDQDDDDEKAAAPKKKARVSKAAASGAKENASEPASATGFVIDVARDDSTHARVDILLRCDAAQLTLMDDAALVKALCLRETLSTKQMLLWTPENKLRHYASVRDIAREFVVQRFYVYELRKQYSVALLEYKHRLALNRYRFIDAFVNGRIEVRNRTDEQIVQACESVGLERDLGQFIWQHPDAPPLDVLERAAAAKSDEDAKDDNEDDDGDSKKNKGADDDDEEDGGGGKTSDHYDGFGYLLKQNIATLSRKKMAQLAEKAKKIEREIGVARAITVSEMWRGDLTTFEAEYVLFLGRKADSLQNEPVDHKAGGGFKKGNSKKGANAGGKKKAATTVSVPRKKID